MTKHSEEAIADAKDTIVNALHRITLNSVSFEIYGICLTTVIHRTAVGAVLRPIEGIVIRL